jgi:putative sigma-54 modulation protein
MRVKVEFTGRHIDITEPIRKFALDRLERLRSLPEIIEAHFILTAENRQRYIAEINLKTRNDFHNSTDTTSDLYTSIASVLDKLEKQVQKSKTKNLKQRRAAVNPRVIEAESVAEVDPEIAEHLPEIIRSDQAGIKPLSIDDAVTELVGSDHGFFLFRNSKSDRLNVVYRRKDGDIGWIDPDQ